MSLVYSGYVPPLRPFKSAEHNVIDYRLDKPEDYSIGFIATLARAEIWHMPFINVEHDMEISDSHVDELMACPHEFCTFAYKIHKPHMVFLDLGRVGPYEGDYLAHNAQCDWFTDGNEQRAFRPVPDDAETCHYTGIGFVKITPDIYAPNIPICHWTDLETHVNDMVIRSGNRWHIHWPAVQHWHR